jgi:hypothetical protein
MSHHERTVTVSHKSHQSSDFNATMPLNLVITLFAMVANAQDCEGPHGKGVHPLDVSHIQEKGCT